MARFMILTKRRLILYSVAIVTLFFLFKVTTSFLDDSPTQSSFETKQTMRQLLDEADRGSVEAYYRLGRLFEQGLETPQDLVRAHAW
jgi:TPR repeat protein